MLGQINRTLTWLEIVAALFQEISCNGITNEYIAMPFYSVISFNKTVFI